jgi:hypothetical protein
MSLGPAAAVELHRTRTDIAMRAMTSATELIQRLEEDLERAFDVYLHAQAQCKEQGIACDYEMSPAMAAGFSEFKQRQFRAEIREERL